MRTEAEIRERLAQLQQIACELRTIMAELDDRRWSDLEARRQYEDAADRKVEVDRDRNMLAWVLGEEQ